MKQRLLQISPILSLALIVILAGCSAYQSTGGTTKRDNTKRGAAIGAAAGAVGAILAGKEEADDILARAAIGAAVGAGVGAYMDRQEERLARIPGTTVERVGEDTLLVHFDEGIRFPRDSAVLDPSARGQLDQLVNVIVDFPATAVVVQGHSTDMRTEEENERLSERRAEGVADYLVSRGIESDRISAIGHGESYYANNRVDILLKGQAR